jgi:hypothetical protein
VQAVAAPLGRPALDLDPAVVVKDLAPAVQLVATTPASGVAPAAEKVAEAMDLDPLLVEIGRQAEPRQLHPHALRNRRLVKAASVRGRPTTQASAAGTSLTVTRKLPAPIGTTTATAKSPKAPATKPPRA